MSRMNHTRKRRTCLARLFLGDLFGCLHPVQCYQPKGEKQTVRTPPRALPDCLPANHLAPPFPILAPLEPRVTRDQLLQDRMQLIFGSQAQFERIHERDEALSSLCDPFPRLGTCFARMFDRGWDAHFDSVQGGGVIHLGIRSFIHQLFLDLSLTRY